MSDDRVHEAHQLAQQARRIAGLPALLAKFIDTANEAWVIVDAEGRIVLFNRKATSLFGWKPEQVIDEPVELLLPEALREIHANVHRAGYVRDPYPRAMGANLDLQARHRTGTTFPVLIDLHWEMSDEGELYVRAAIKRKQVAEPSAVPEHSLTSPEAAS